MSSERILIRSSLARWPAFLLGSFGAVLVLVGALLATIGQMEPLGIALCIGSAVLILFAFIIETRRVKQLMWIALDDHRFTITDNIGERTFNDDDIVSMALKYKENFENGVLKSITRTFRIWIVSHADQPELIEMITRLKTGAADPLQSFIERIVHLLKDRAHAEQAQGHSVLGEKWSLEGKRLILRDPKRGEIETMIEEIIAVDYIDNKLKLWRQGEDACFAELPHDSANCHLLKVMLDDEIAQRPQRKEKELAEGQLGRIIFERKPPRHLGTFLFILAAVGLIAGIVLILRSFDPANFREAIGLRIAGIFFSVMGVLLGLGGWYSMRSLFRCQAYGVYQQTLGGEKSIHFDEMAAFTYTAVRHHAHFDLPTFIIFAILRSLKQETAGTTHLKMTFHPKPGTKKKKIVYGTSVRNVDSSLDAMRDHIASMLASRLIQAVHQGETVEWTPILTLTPKGLRYTPKGFFGKKTPELVAYHHISDHNMEQGKLSIFRYDKPKPIVTEATSARNFFPGYVAFLALLSEAKGDHSPPEFDTASD